MAIEGPLRELGIHDVFVLLDLSRKTGVLRVSSALRQDEGVVLFSEGRVIQAAIRSSAAPPEVTLLRAGRISEADLEHARARQTNGRSGAALPELLVELGAISAKELERQLRSQIQSVVFELMSWQEGFFSFEERSESEMPGDTRISVSTEALLMEAARRIDEWSRIADVVPNVNVVPELAPVDGDHDGATLDLLPHEWQVLTMIDRERDLRAIAGALGRDDFEIAKIAYGLAVTGVIVLRGSRQSSPPTDRNDVEARLASARTLTRAARHAEAIDELRRALQADPLRAVVHLELGFALARAGDLPAARTSWEHFLRLAPTGAEADRVRGALAAATRLQNVLEAHADG